MVGFSTISLVSIVLIAALVQVPVVKHIGRAVWLGFAIGKDIQPITDFQRQCRRLEDPRLQACEDLWISEAQRKLYLACSDPHAREQWAPGESKFNATGRSTRDAIVSLDLDTLDFKELRFSGYQGVAGDGLINHVGFTGVDLPDGSVQLLVTNFRPSIDPSTGEVVPDQEAVGANATLEVFKTGADVDTLEWVETILDPVIISPNRMATVNDHGFYFTNDHGSYKSGILKKLSPVLKTGTVAFCSSEPSRPCEIVSTGHSYPNGLIYSPIDEKLYVPCSAEGGVKVFKVHHNGSLESTGSIDLPYVVDNLSEDKEGTIWAAIIPHGINFFEHAKRPFEYIPPSTVFKISRTEDGLYSTQKVIEDRDGEVLPGTTTVVHDVTTGRLFMGGVFSPFITVCEPEVSRH